MVPVRPATPDQAALLGDLLSAGLLMASGVPGLYGHGAIFSEVIDALDALVTRSARADAPERMRFPPVLARHYLETNEYLQSFPHLAGTVFAFDGTEAQATEQAERARLHQDWSAHQRMTDLALTPAACYPAYPAVAARGPLPSGGVVLDLGAAWVFRHEPSGDPARLQSFHQREVVRMGEPEAVVTWRDTWRDRAVVLLRSIGLQADADVASDPFFGRAGRILAAGQREQQLKFEILVQIAGPEPTAVASFNYHQAHFSGRYGLVTAAGDTAHTACLGFGLERIAVALFHSHGLDVAGWPSAARSELWPD